MVYLLLFENLLVSAGSLAYTTNRVFNQISNIYDGLHARFVANSFLLIIFLCEISDLKNFGQCIGFFRNFSYHALVGNI